MILVSAATGELGRLVVDSLLDRIRAAETAVAVRNPDTAADLSARGVDVRHGDYDDPSSLRTAFTGVDALLFISAPVTESGRLEQHHNVVKAAEDAGVGMLAYTSGLGADLVDETEQWITQSGMPYRLLRHPIYSETYINAGLHSAIEAGELTSSTRGRGLNTATRADLAEAAAVVLTAPNSSPNAYNFTGPLWTYPQLGEVLGEVSGRPVAYREVDAEQGFLEMLAEIVRYGGFEVQTDDLQRVLGRPAMSLRESVVAALQSLDRG